MQNNVPVQTNNKQSLLRHNSNYIMCLVTEKNEQMNSHIRL